MIVTRIKVCVCVVLVGLGCVPWVSAQQATVAGTGTTNSIPIWTNSTTLGNSKISQTTTGASVGTTLQLPAIGTATASQGFNSQSLDLAASAFNKSIATAVPQHFRWTTEPVGNNTASPTGKLDLLFAPGAAAPAETGVSFSNTGFVTAKRLISTVATGTAPFGVTSTTVVPNLNASLLGGFAAGAFARLAAANSFTANQSITGNLGVTGTVSGGAGAFGSLGVTGLISGGAGSFAGNLSANGDFGVSGNATVNGGSGLGVANNLSVGGSETIRGPIQFTDDGVGGDLQQSLLINAVDCCSFGNRMIWAHSPAFAAWGILYDDSGFDGPADTMHWQTSTGSDVMSVEFESGNLNVTGAITAGVKDFRIDHPLDPKNKYLYHTSVESSEMMNIYTGNAILDNSGEAVISLPKWFEALNADFRYQLTAIGAAAPNLHIAQEIAQNQFSIAGGAPGMKVSWQVTGVRHDPYAKAHPLAVEVRKSEKTRGQYLHPDAYGAPRLTQEQMLTQQPRQR